MPNPLTRWIRETPRKTDGAPAGGKKAREIRFHQAEAGWVEFKRLHLAFVQTLFSLLNGNSTPMNLVRQAMLCANELNQLRESSAPLQGGEPVTPETIISSLPLQGYEQVYRLFCSGSFDEKALDGLADAGNLHIGRAILQLAAHQLAGCDRQFHLLASKEGFEDPERANKWTDEIMAMNAKIIDVYSRELKARKLI